MPQESTSAAGIAWNLSDLFDSPTDPRINQILEECQQGADQLALDYRNRINTPEGPTPAFLLSALERFEVWTDKLYRVAAYAQLLYAADTQTQAHRDLQERVDQKYTALANTILFFDLEWRALPDDVAARISSDAVLATYKHYLERERQFRSHTLTEPEEKVINEKDVTGSQAWARLFTEQQAGIVFKLERDGQEQQLNQSRLLALLYEPERNLRKQAHDTFYHTLAGHASVMAFVYETLILDKLTEDRLRDFSNPMAARHLRNDVSEAAVEQMMKVTADNYSIAHDYFRLKAKVLGLDPLMIYDQYAPMGTSVSKVPYVEGKTIVLDALRAASPRLEQLAAQFFEKGWIDADPRSGKRGGAFCMGVSPTMHPYILCNYTDTARDVMTVAHEMGHGLHDLLASKQTLYNYHPTLPLAETASVFSEMLTFDMLTKRVNDPKELLILVAGKVEEIFATVFRQNVLTQFERSAFDARKQGRLTPEALGDLWISANSPYYGDALTMTAEYRGGWSYIPHFIHTPFYCYAYVFGELLVLALYAMYRQEGASFIPRYLRLLEAGGSESPADLLKDLGVDIADPLFWNRGFTELRRMVDWVGQLVEQTSAGH